MKTKLFLAILFLIFPLYLYAQDRKPAVSGAFYPAAPEMLRNLINEYLKNANVEKDKIPKGEVFGLVCPHAGYPYSGPVAGYSYKVIEGLTFDTVIVIGTNHRVYGFNDVSVWNKGSFETPLGKIPVDTEYADSIISESPKKFLFYADAHREEHSVEVQLPFLQVVLTNFKLVPVVIGDFSPQTCKGLADAILKHKGDRKILIIASTDLSHDMPYARAVTMDGLGLRYTENLDIDELIKAESNGVTQMCGFGPVLTLLYAAKEAGNVKGVLLKYANSGDITGDKSSRIVGYGAAAFYSAKGGSASGGKEGGAMENSGYTLDEKKALLKLARDTITDYLNRGKKVEYPVFSEKFKENRGVFVTLHKHGELRGCIGYIEPIKPLQQAVIENAVNSAVHDTRFPPVTVNELKDIEIEISVLTPPAEIKCPEEFIPGKHGIIIRKVFYGAVFLPQVAPEQGWTREETLSHLCHKAGLPQDEWKKPGMKYYVFTAIVFGEKELNAIR